ncbi:hypothetical protein HELRODRAFT_164374 [Helobdella robusta]|uniref:Uncharacterized protein n=1 Tax=Helobdella robusta TaxID=6412 RepID=T1EVC2_HELRO|nr:hypothetical protein HELRODRAFT_164374 [Helobdella robusta]ESN94518.1 hypothetical protein HELRODRAFT_164374 [Helobdella robusta]
MFIFSNTEKVAKTSDTETFRETMFKKRHLFNNPRKKETYMLLIYSAPNMADEIEIVRPTDEESKRLFVGQKYVMEFKSKHKFEKLRLLNYKMIGLITVERMLGNATTVEMPKEVKNIKIGIRLLKHSSNIGEAFEEDL